MQIYSEKKQLSIGKKKMYSVERIAAGRVLELSPVFKEIKILRKSLIFNEVIEVVTSGQDPTQLTSNCGEEVKKSLSSEGSHRR